MEGYFDQSGRDDVWTGGVKMIPIETSLGTFQVWTKRIGNHPTKKLLLLHGGPGATHEYFESADSYFPGESIEYYYYDQLGSGNSDPSEQKELWSIEHYVEEVEQVRTALDLSADNMVPLLTGFLTAAITGYLALQLLLKFVRSGSLDKFAFYLWPLAAVSIGMSLAG